MILRNLPGWILRSAALFDINEATKTGRDQSDDAVCVCILFWWAVTMRRRWDRPRGKGNAFCLFHRFTHLLTKWRCLCCFCCSKYMHYISLFEKFGEKRMGSSSSTMFIVIWNYFDMRRGRSGPRYKCWSAIKCTTFVYRCMASAIGTAGTFFWFSDNSDANTWIIFIWGQISH